eukprot:2820574-Prymnesium_polylepis.2
MVAMVALVARAHRDATTRPLRPVLLSVRVAASAGLLSVLSAEHDVSRLAPSTMLAAAAAATAATAAAADTLCGRSE